MNFYNFTDLLVPNSIATTQFPKSKMLNGSSVWIFNNEEHFLTTCMELAERISGVVLLKSYNIETNISNNLLTVLPLDSFLNLPEAIQLKSLSHLLKSMENKREYFSLAHVKEQELKKVTDQLNLVTENYYKSVQRLESNSQVQLKRKDAILALSNKVSKIASFQINLTNNSVTFADEFYSLFENGENSVKFTLDNGLTHFPKGINRIIIQDIKDCIDNRKNYYKEFCINEQLNEWYVLQMTHLEDLATPTVLGIFQNISSRKKLEIDTEDQKQKTMLASRLAALGEMCGGIAHEINTPLSILTLLMTRLNRKLQTSGQSNDEFLTIINQARTTIEKIAAIVRGLRLLYLDGTRSELIQSTLNQIIQEVITICTPKLKQQNVKIDFFNQTQLENKKLYLAEVQISQILVNLINNSVDAIEHMPERWIKVNLFQETPEEFIISVIDSGGGIPPNIRDTIFNPFFTTKEVGKGTGLGLSLSKSLAKTFNGDLYLFSKNENTQFNLIIPIRPIL